MLLDMQTRLVWKRVLQSSYYVIGCEASTEPPIRRWEVYELDHGLGTASMQINFHFPLSVTSTIAQSIEVWLWDTDRTSWSATFEPGLDVMQHIFDWAGAIVLDPLEQLAQTEET